jgi:hypothetical protein
MKNLIQFKNFLFFAILSTGVVGCQKAHQDLGSLDPIPNKKLRGNPVNVICNYAWDIEPSNDQMGGAVDITTPAMGHVPICGKSNQVGGNAMDEDWYVVNTQVFPNLVTSFTAFNETGFTLIIRIAGGAQFIIPNHTAQVVNLLPGMANRIRVISQTNPAGPNVSGDYSLIF